MKTSKLALVIFLLSFVLVASPAQWTPGSGIQTTFDASAWPGVLEELRSAHISSGAYKVSKRTRAYDHQVTIQTPFASAARYVQERKDRETPITFEEVAKRFDNTRLVLELKTQHRNPQVAESVLLALKTEKGTIQPFKDDLVSSIPQKIGFYAEQYQVVTRTFTFDLAQLSGVRSLAVVVIEEDGKMLEIPVKLEKLR